MDSTKMGAIAFPAIICAVNAMAQIHVAAVIVAVKEIAQNQDASAHLNQCL